jgi:hypothetical protein
VESHLFIEWENSSAEKREKEIRRGLILKEGRPSEAAFFYM